MMDASSRARAAAAHRASVERGDPLEPARLADAVFAPADDEVESEERAELEPVADRARNHAA